MKEVVNMKTIDDVNKLRKSELMRYAMNNAKYVNQQLKALQENDMEYSKAYRYVQNKLSNVSYTRMKQDGSIEFKSRKSELEKLTANQLRSLVKKLSDYKQTASGTVRGQKKIIEKAYNNFLQSDTLSDDTKEKLSNMTQEEYTEMWKSQTMQDMKEKFGSDQVLRFVGTVGFDKAENIWINEKIETLHDMYEKAEKLDDFFG